MEKINDATMKFILNLQTQVVKINEDRIRLRKDIRATIDRLSLTKGADMHGAVLNVITNLKRTLGE